MAGATLRGVLEAMASGTMAISGTGMTEITTTCVPKRDVTGLRAAMVVVNSLSRTG